MSGKRLAALLLALAISQPAASAEAAGGSLEGWIGLEARLFEQAPSQPGQRRHGAALVLHPTWSRSLGERSQWDLRLSPYLRLDAVDEASRYLDLREAVLRWRDGDSLWRVGMETVHWSVVESHPLANIVNQIDPRADIDQEARLGQPLVAYTRFHPQWGRLELLWLPWFRPRPQLGLAARPRLEPVATGSVPHGLAPWRRSDDAALRWSGTAGGMDMSLYGFRGLSREPDVQGDGTLAHRRITQWGLTAQLPSGNMLWKLEAIHRRGQGRDFAAWVAGGEYTLTFGAGELGLLLERLSDRRDATAPSARFADAWLAGLRWRANEQSDAELLYGLLHDRAARAWVHKLDVSRRLGASVRLGLIGRKIVCEDDSAYGPLCLDDHLQVNLNYSF